MKKPKDTKKYVVKDERIEDMLVYTPPFEDQNWMDGCFLFQEKSTSIQTIQRFSTGFTPLVPSRYVEAEILMAATGHALPP